ncbi:MAG: ATP-binding cassette domain-containing protein [Verrucomicrobiae bacterium]|nr:ATP-binding cassette domain-containing protein [Verrucomicrobiae bacterium]
MSPSARAADQPILRVAHLGVTRGPVTLLADIHWTVAPGQHWVILGANGSGKTSLLAALTGYLTPTAGTLELLGHRYGQAHWPELRKRVGLVSSALRQWFHDDEPALEIVAGGRYATIDLRERLRPADARQAAALLALVDVPSLADRPWAFLSQGERQRVLIARGLMAQPDLLILDEPCAGLDPVARERFLDLVSRLGHSPHPALVLVTHHVEEIAPVFRHALLLHAGRVAAAGPVKETLTSTSLSRIFGAPLQLRQSRGRYTLRLDRSRRRTGPPVKHSGFAPPSPFNL